MIIHPPRKTQFGDQVEVSAKVELGRRGRSMPSSLWFRFPVSSRPCVDQDPFAVALLLVAMQSREDLELRGSISRRLRDGMMRYQQVYESWFPKRFRRVGIHADALRDDPAPEAVSQGCAFSGGVDSFYTLFKKGREIRHALFMAGFDMPLHLASSTEELTRSYSALMEERGIEFISGSTNVRAFVDTVDWTNAHGQALLASALFFRDRISTFSIPSSYRAGSYPKWGTHPDLDPLLSTEAIRFEHHGAEADRVSKLREIVRHSASHSRLRVCWNQAIGLRNCGECEKCVRTMIALELLGTRARYTTFPPGGLTPTKIRELTLRTHQARVFARELLLQAARGRSWGICRDLAVSLVKRELCYLPHRLKKLSGLR